MSQTQWVGIFVGLIGFSFASDKHVTWFACYTLRQALFFSPSLSPAEQVRDFLILSADKANDSEIRSNRGARLSVLAPKDWHGAGLHSLHLIGTMNDMVCGPVLTVKRGKDKSVKVPTSVARRKCPCAQ